VLICDHQRGCFPALPSKLKKALGGIWPVS
jgi:hypothetical protein